MIAVSVALAVAITGGSGRISPPDRPDWEVKPTGEAVSRAYPALAAALGLEGQATVHCGVSPAGELHDCHVVDFKGPKGLGFEAASLSLTPMFRIRPARAASGKAEESTVGFPLTFRLPPARGDFPDPGAPLSPEGLAAARAQVALFSATIPLDRMFEQANRHLAATGTPGVDPATRQEVLDTIKQAQAQVRTEVLDYQARVLAAHVPAPQIDASVKFGRTNGAQKLYAAAPIVQKAGEAFVSSRFLQLVYGMHQAFCGVKDCNGASAQVALSEPPWIETPTSAQVEAAQPKLALIFAISGYADLTCGSSKSGVLTNCKIVREAPKDLGFGAGALALAASYRRPPGIGGEETSLRVSFPMPPIPKIDPPPVPAQTDAKETLALKVIMAEGLPQQLKRQEGAWIRAIESADLPGVPEETRAQAITAVQTALGDLGKEVAPFQARIYAGILTDRELEERLAFVSGPDNAPYLVMMEKLDAANRDSGLALAARVMTEAGRLYCAKHDCPKLPPYRGPSSPADAPFLPPKP